MPKYMLVLRDDPKEYKNYSPEEFQKLIEKYRAWSGRMSAEGRLVASNKLMDEGGKVMRSHLGEVYGPGFDAFQELLAEWRGQGDLEGMSVAS